MYKIDLHTHSTASPDGGLRAQDYRRALKGGLLDYIAVTDHDNIEFAQKLHHEIGSHIIVGEEVSTTDGEIVGLYLQQPIPPGLSAVETVHAIKNQSGLVYIPHPFESVRHGISFTTLNEIADYVDIVEIYNGRAIFQNRSAEARRWAARHNAPGASSSDAHGRIGWGRTFSLIVGPPSAVTLGNSLKDAQHIMRTVGLLGSAYPKFNRLRKKVNHA
ncbi:MAG TPA: PHP domain-containing protein [Candidatus Saccharimonadales bacterium]|nr:PHP domain-containing protein [Candidatus Saccharimonadales bacterium]